MKAKRNLLDLPLPRFNELSQVKAIVKKTRSRCTCFWLEVDNVSGSGVGIVHQGNGYVPFAVDDELHLTLDTSCTVFRRPIHIKVRVKWRGENAVGQQHEPLMQRTTLGCQIVLVDPVHFSDWSAGLQKLSNRAS